MANGPKTRLRILWLGETARAEFAAAAEIVCRHSDCTVVPPAEVEAEAASGVFRETTAGVVDLIVAAESFPEELPPTLLAALRRRHPTARWVRVVGPWCDGELRSASPPPATLRIAWQRAAGWFERQIRRFEAGKPTEFDDPATFDEADRVSASLPQPGTGDRRATIGVWAAEPAAREWLSDVVTRRAPAGTICRPNSGDGVQIALCDLPTADRPVKQVAEIRKAHPRAALVILVGFARPGDVRALYEAGAAVVLPKPVLVADLEAAIQESLRRLK